MLGCCLEQGGGCGKAQPVSTRLLPFAVPATETEAAFACPLVGTSAMLGENKGWTASPA